MRSVMSAFVAVLVICTIAGCGGGGASNDTNTGRATGSASFTIHWPVRSRLIPTASNSIRVTVAQGSVTVGDQLLPRPAGLTTNATFDALPVGTLSLTAAAFPNADGSGVAQAAATIPLTIAANKTTNFSLTMNSTIASLTIGPSNPAAQVGKTAALTATAMDAAGSIVLLSPAKLQWSSADTAIASVDATGTVTAVSAGATAITVKDTESGKSASVGFSSAILVDDFNDNSTNTLLWTPVFAGTGPTLAETNQRLEITVPDTSGGLPVFEAGYQSKFKLKGDFDIQVDYQVLTWPPNNGMRVGITLTDAALPSVAAVSRVSQAGTVPGGESHSATLGHAVGDETVARVATSVAAGKLRMVRTGVSFNSLYWDAATNKWVSLLVGNNGSNDITVTLRAWSSDTEFQHMAEKVVFDNFRVTKGTVMP